MAHAPNIRLFSTCPLITTASVSDSPPAPWHLIAQIKTNMTITKPTLIATDSSGEDFALTFDDVDADLARFRTGWTAVVPMAMRTPAPAGRTTGEGKGFVAVPRGCAAAVRVVPGPVKRVVGLLAARGEEETQRPERAGGGNDVALGLQRECAECRKHVESRKCLGCSSVWFCGKVSRGSDCSYTASYSIIGRLMRIWGAGVPATGLDIASQGGLQDAQGHGRDLAMRVMHLGRMYQSSILQI